MGLGRHVDGALQSHSARLAFLIQGCQLWTATGLLCGPPRIIAILCHMAGNVCFPRQGHATSWENWQGSTSLRCHMSRRWAVAPTPEPFVALVCTGCKG